MTIRFTDEKLAELSPTHRSYVGAFARATRDASRSKFLLKRDARLLKGRRKVRHRFGFAQRRVPRGQRQYPGLLGGGTRAGVRADTAHPLEKAMPTK